jgi:hypothetical protein
MQKKRRNGRASTEMSVEDEIAHLRGAQTQKPPRFSLDGSCRCVVFARRYAASSGARTWPCLLAIGRTAASMRCQFVGPTITDGV